MVWSFFMSFHVAILRFAPEGLSLFGGHVTIVKSNKVKESFHEIDKRSHYGTGTEPICHKIWPGSDHLLSGIQASFYVRISRREETDRKFLELRDLTLV